MNIETLSNKMKVAFFDMDGTLLDTMQEWRQCNVEHLNSIGIFPTQEELPHILQASSAVILFDYIKQRYGVDIDRSSFQALQKERMLKVYSGEPIVKPGVIDYLKKLRSRGVISVITTATWATHTNIALSRTGLIPYIDAIYTSDSIELKKNNPDYFKKVAEMVGHSVDECVLYEDAIYAIKSGKEAGLLGTIALEDATNTLFRKDLQEEADILVGSLNDLP